MHQELHDTIFRHQKIPILRILPGVHRQPLIPLKGDSDLLTAHRQLEREFTGVPGTHTEPNHDRLRVPQVPVLSQVLIYAPALEKIALPAIVVNKSREEVVCLLSRPRFHARTLIPLPCRPHRALQGCVHHHPLIDTKRNLRRRGHREPALIQHIPHHVINRAAGGELFKIAVLTAGHVPQQRQNIHTLTELIPVIHNMGDKLVTVLNLIKIHTARENPHPLIRAGYIRRGKRHVNFDALTDFRDTQPTSKPRPKVRCRIGHLPCDSARGLIETGGDSQAAGQVTRHRGRNLHLVHTFIGAADIDAGVDDAHTLFPHIRLTGLHPPDLGRPRIFSTH